MQKITVILSSEGFGIPVAPSKTTLGKKHYLEWQIGYDDATTNSAGLVPEIRFVRNGETKYGQELSKIIFEAVRLGVLSTNDLVREIETLKTIKPTEFEENQAVQVEMSPTPRQMDFKAPSSGCLSSPRPRRTAGCRSSSSRNGAVGDQAMVYVCLPMNERLTLDGSPRKTGPAKSKETVFYDFDRDNAAFLLDIIHGFGIASQPHNGDMRYILGKILKPYPAGELKFFLHHRKKPR